jgi:hypothetical protein
MTELDVVGENVLLRIHATRDISELDLSAHDAVFRCANGLYLAIQMLEAEKPEPEKKEMKDEQFVLSHVRVH